MTHRFLLGLAALLLSFVPLGLHAQRSSGENDPHTGRDFALQFCTACHVVAPDQRQRPIYRGPTPSFSSIANRPKVSAESLRQFVRTTHPTITEPLHMPPVEVSDYQLDQIIAYILSLRRTR